MNHIELKELIFPWSLNEGLIGAMYRLPQLFRHLTRQDLLCMPPFPGISTFDKDLYRMTCQEMAVLKGAI